MSPSTLVVGRQTVTEHTSYDDEAEIRRIRQAVEDAENQGDAAAFAELFASDVAVRTETTRIDGAHDVEAFHRDIYDRQGLDIHFTPDDVLVLGGLAVEHGTYTIDLTAKETGETRREGGRYLYTYERDNSGGWKIHRMSWG